jgi:hypothetical protein
VVDAKHPAGTAKIAIFKRSHKSPSFFKMFLKFIFRAMPAQTKNIFTRTWKLFLIAFCKQSPVAGSGDDAHAIQNNVFFCQEFPGHNGNLEKLARHPRDRFKSESSARKEMSCAIPFGDYSE